MYGFLSFQVKELFKELNVKCNAIELDMMGKSTTTVYHCSYQMNNQMTYSNSFLKMK